ncbi:TPA: DUF551 domain-containing protein [Escherichia coli]|uniref:DUF551 domain-containing protein n=1 Tax=Salmonella enterica subsp. enterica serovar Typhi str. 404ty TaxID=497977 RepID=A0A720R9H1_SALTI|nr:DUF551 domain-containing protein [Escherichia coli]NRH70725.1 DUF551 domain-containing protein [Salmonella enterica subsp. enterica serovar Typhi]SAP89012.1 Protein of uncharacterised function (DUF551) [Klebsiella oxytoca]HAD7818104.1 DUF551 domain-containing protein [Salmonella enterica subsp. enterica serovar Typhi str. 404ty]MBC9695338.1 DUF551 domain-containing protein [Escherichia coli]MCM2848706.1 DUF551 domain-containing protein [Escherichia coli]
MITITKERLLTIKQWRETYGPDSNVVLPAEEAEELARIALAALEVEPIGFRCRRNDNLGDWSYVYHREPDDFERKHLVIEGIYAAPPAPVVPEEKPMPNPLSMYAVDAVAAIAEVRGWNACRAAMLQSQDSGIKDSWISCSERMPNTKTAVLVAVEFDRKGDWRMKWATYIPGHPDANDGWIIPGASWKPSHWMPLPEPPQEVNQ